MPSPNGNDPRRRHWGSGANAPELDDLFRKGLGLLNQNLPASGTRGVIVLAVIALAARMISERRQIAERFLSEGNGEAARIRGNRVRDLNKTQSEAYREVEEIRGVADAKATEIYASA